MRHQRISLRFGVLLGMLLLAAASRLVPHPANFAPVGAMALLGGAYFRSRPAAYLLPVLSLWLSDPFLNNVVYAEYYGGFTLFHGYMVWVYGSMLLTTLMGARLLKQVKAHRVALSALLASVLFFAVTNFGCWPGSALYTQDLSGLMTCFAAGIPFFKGTLLGNLFHCAVLFGGFELAQRRISELRPAHARA